MLSHPHSVPDLTLARLRADARGRDGGIREELAGGSIRQELAGGSEGLLK